MTSGLSATVRTSVRLITLPVFAGCFSLFHRSTIFRSCSGVNLNSWVSFPVALLTRSAGTILPPICLRSRVNRNWGWGLAFPCMTRWMWLATCLRRAPGGVPLRWGIFRRLSVAAILSFYDVLSFLTVYVGRKVHAEHVVRAHWQS